MKQQTEGKKWLIFDKIWNANFEIQFQSGMAFLLNLFCPCVAKYWSIGNFVRFSSKGVPLKMKNRTKLNFRKNINCYWYQRFFFTFSLGSSNQFQSTHRLKFNWTFAFLIIKFIFKNLPKNSRNSSKISSGLWHTSFVNLVWKQKNSHALFFIVDIKFVKTHKWSKIIYWNMQI